MLQVCHKHENSSIILTAGVYYKFFLVNEILALTFLCYCYEMTALIQCVTFYFFRKVTEKLVCSTFSLRMLSQSPVKLSPHTHTPMTLTGLTTLLPSVSRFRSSGVHVCAAAHTQVFSCM